MFCPLTPLQKEAYERVLASPDFQNFLQGGRECPDHKKMVMNCCESELYPLDGSFIWDYFHPKGKKCGGRCPSCTMLPCIAQLLKLSNHLEMVKVKPGLSEKASKYAIPFAQLALGLAPDEVSNEFC